MFLFLFILSTLIAKSVPCLGIYSSFAACCDASAAPVCACCYLLATERDAHQLSYYQSHAPHSPRATGLRFVTLVLLGTCETAMRGSTDTAGGRGAELLGVTYPNQGAGK
jgi:hypothetical protein